MTPLEQAIDDAYVCGQIDVLSSLLVPYYDPGQAMLELLLVPGGFQKRRDELLWSFWAWRFAFVCAMAAGR
jgi:hypothetical protein